MELAQDDYLLKEELEFHVVKGPKTKARMNHSLTREVQSCVLLQTP